MADEPFELSVVIVCRNMQAALKTTIASVVGLADPRLHLYIVDGASTDGTPDYLRTLPAGSASWISEPDHGIYDAMNKGWNMVPSGAAVLYLGAGDKLVSPPSDASIATLRATAGRIVIGICHIGTREFRSSWNADLRYGNMAHHQAMLVPRAAWPVSPFDTSLRVYADWDFNVRLFKAGTVPIFDDSFQTYAEPGGVSAIHQLPEIVRVAFRHGGAVVAMRSYVRNWRQRRIHLRALAQSRLNKVPDRQPRAAPLDD